MMNLLQEFKKVESKCPMCLAKPSEIVYQNSGPIVRVYCTKCGYICSDMDAKVAGFPDVIDYWNRTNLRL
jgi:hypothetical protein